MAQFQRKPVKTPSTFPQIKGIDFYIDGSELNGYLYNQLVYLKTIDYLENVEQMFRWIFIACYKAASEEHPELTFEKKHMDFWYEHLVDESDVEILFGGVRFLFALQENLPKKLALFSTCIELKYKDEKLYSLFNTLAKQVKKEGKLYNFDFINLKFDHNLEDFTTKDWKTATNNYQGDKIEEFVSYGRTYGEQLEIIDLIETRYKMDAAQPWGLGLTGVNFSYFSALREMLAKRFSSHVEVSVPVQKRDKELEAKLKTANKKIEELQAEVGKLKKELESALEDSTPENSQHKPRTRYVASVALYRLLKKLITDDPTNPPTYENVATLMEYFTNYSFNSVRTEIVGNYSFKPHQRAEVEHVNVLLENAHIDFSLKYPKE